MRTKKLLLQQDDCAPDSLEWFKREMFKAHGLHFDEFNKQERHWSDDKKSYWHELGNFSIELCFDDPYWKLYKLSDFPLSADLERVIHVAKGMCSELVDADADYVELQWQDYNKNIENAFMEGLESLAAQMYWGECRAYIAASRRPVDVIPDTNQSAPRVKVRNILTIYGITDRNRDNAVREIMEVYNDGRQRWTKDGIMLGKTLMFEAFGNFLKSIRDDNEVKPTTESKFSAERDIRPKDRQGESS